MYNIKHCLQISVVFSVSVQIEQISKSKQCPLFSGFMLHLKQYAVQEFLKGGDKGKAKPLSMLKPERFGYNIQNDLFTAFPKSITEIRSACLSSGISPAAISAAISKSL